MQAPGISDQTQSKLSLQCPLLRSQMTLRRRGRLGQQRRRVHPLLHYRSAPGRAAAADHSSSSQAHWTRQRDKLRCQVLATIKTPALPIKHENRCNNSDEKYGKH